MATQHLAETERDTLECLIGQRVRTTRRPCLASRAELITVLVDVEVKDSEYIPRIVHGRNNGVEWKATLQTVAGDVVEYELEEVPESWMG